ncbi:MAG: hypothetical protein ACP6KW_00880 [Candidatus Thorarchaeota archaeon]
MKTEVSEEFVRLCGEVGAFTKSVTGTSIVDAYFGPEEFDPARAQFDGNVLSLVGRLSSVVDRIRDEVSDELRRDYLIGETESLIVVMRWLSGESMTYSELVEGLFGLRPKKFRESVIDESIAVVEEAFADFPGSDLRDKIRLFSEDGQVTGESMKQLVEGDLQHRALEVGRMFRDTVFAIMGASVTDNGVTYEAVSGKPWSGYNWYLGGFRSLNQFNIDRKFNSDTLRGVIYHEYEHHVSNLWREHQYNKTGALELSLVPLHTGRCVISEGTADTAKEFLGVDDGDPRTRAINALYALRRMTSINAAIMLNQDNRSEEEAVDYMVDRGHRSREAATASLGFIGRTTRDGNPNLWSPYIMTYFIGRTDFVLPTFSRAKEEDQLPEFFRTLYLNQYSGSSRTWRRAFEWLN